jgi:hypothetical protein
MSESNHFSLTTVAARNLATETVAPESNPQHTATFAGA